MVKTRISASDVSNYITLPFIIYCSRFVDEKYKDPIDPFNTLLQKEGKKFEKEIVHEKFKDAFIIPDVSEHQRFELLLDAMKKGVPAVYQGPLLDSEENLAGYTDVLVRRNSHNSNFGNYHYVVYEIKNRKAPSNAHFIQAAFYNYVLGKIQGYTPDKFYFITNDKKEIGYDFSKYSHQLKEAINGVRNIIEGKEVPEPVYGVVKYDWANYTDELAIKRNDLSIIQGIRKKTLVLHKAGYKTIKELANAKKQDLIKIKGIGEKTVETILRNTKAFYTQNPIVYDRLKLKIPKAKEEIYIDFETAGESEDGEVPAMAYMLGVLYKEGKKWVYKPFIAENAKDGEKELLDGFIKFLKLHPNSILYQWTGFELEEFNKMFEKYKVKAKEADFVRKRLFDLCMLFQTGIAMPTYSNSIKDIAPWLGFKWRQKDVNGTNSMVLYYDYLKTKDTRILQKILDYNEDDVLAMKVVREWLRKKYKI